MKKMKKICPRCSNEDQNLFYEGSKGWYCRACIKFSRRLLSEIHYENWDDFKSKNSGKYFYFTRYGKKPHTSFDYSNKDENIYFIFGKESTGIPTNILKPYLDNCMRMPMTDKVRALNLSNTVAIMIYEALRQQNYRDLLFEEPHKSADFIEETG